MPGLGYIGVRLRGRSRCSAPSAPRSSCQALGLASTSLHAQTRRSQKKRESDPVSLDEPFIRNSWMPGPSPGMTVERLCARWMGLRTAPGSGVLPRTSRVAAYPNAYGAWPWHDDVSVTELGSTHWAALGPSLQL